MLDDLTVVGIIQLLNFDIYSLFPYQEISMPKALITGITGQDGSYLAEFLLSKGYEVHGMIRKASTFNTERIDHIYQDPHDSNARLFLHYGDLSQSEMLIYLIYNVQPDEVYNLTLEIFSERGLTI